MINENTKQNGLKANKTNLRLIKIKCYQKEMKTKQNKNTKQTENIKIDKETYIYELRIDW